jgi:tRNA-5-methyluridine54 2-sulfurtransferase
MVCSICSSKVVMSGFCKSHFLEYFENKVIYTIEEFNLLNEKDRVCVAVSGGKDSVVLLYLLDKFGYDVSGLAIDEGIVGYRADTLLFLENFCKTHNIHLVVKSFRDEVGKDLDDMPREGPACNACGTFRRFMLNKYSQGFDKVATGHNLDDESQAVLMNLFKAQNELFARQGPITREAVGFTQKIKPLYYLKEKEILAYAFLMGFDVPFVECPFARLSFRSKVRDFVNNAELNHPGIKENIIERFLSLKVYDKSRSPIKTLICNSCGFPSEGDVCRACRMKADFKISVINNNK